MNNRNYPLYQVGTAQNFQELINQSAEKYAEKTAFTFERGGKTKAISYCEFKHDIDALKTAFFDMGIHNTKIALVGENSYEWILTYFATVNSGNVIVPMDKELPASEIRNLTMLSGAEVFVYSDTYADVSVYLQNNGGKIRHFINTNCMEEMLSRIRMQIQSGEKRVAAHTIDHDTLAALVYTSGTTGMAKGVMLSHKNITSNAIANCQLVAFPDRSLLVLPLHHASGFMGLLGMMLYGSTIKINLSLKHLLHDFSSFNPGLVVLVPLFIETFYKQIMNLAANNQEENCAIKMTKQVFGDSLTTIISGGAPLDKKWVDRYLQLGITILNVYGLTESAALISANRNCFFRAGSGGQIVPCCDVIISNPDENGQGEIYVKGNNIMLGYYQNEQATKEAFEGEWFKTGDIGYLDQDGFLFITGRKKNLIVLSNGKNVYPEEIEFALLNQIPYIKEAVVYAGDNEIIAELFLNAESDPDSISGLDSDIIALNRTLPTYKNIDRTIIRDTEFPKTTTKKIKRTYE